MDQEALVEEQIIAGREFLELFHQQHPVNAAVWMKPVDAQWYLYVASPDITDETTRTIYGTVMQVEQSMTKPFDPFRVRLIKGDDPLVRQVADLHRVYPRGVPSWHQPYLLGGRGIEGAYIYPPLQSVAIAVSKP